MTKYGERSVTVNNTRNAVNLLCTYKIVSISNILLNDNQKINLATKTSLLHNQTKQIEGQDFIINTYPPSKTQLVRLLIL